MTEAEEQWLHLYPELEEYLFEKSTKMLYVGGSTTSFRCTCGANVFTQISKEKYECNGCKALWTGSN